MGPRAVTLTSCIVAVAAISCLLRPDKKTAPMVTAPPAPEAQAAPDRVDGDPTEVYQRAFWRRPAVDDHIVHAERREWLDENGISKWQWFLEVEPSAALVRHLKDDNAFALRKTDTVPVIPSAPGWFCPSGSESTCLASPSGDMTLVFGPNNQTLFATGTGGGFKVGAGTPPPAEPGPQPAQPGRFPNQPPPSPR